MALVSIPNTAYCAHRCFILCCCCHFCPCHCPHPYRHDKSSSSSLESPFPHLTGRHRTTFGFVPPSGRYPTQRFCPDVDFVVVVVVLIIFVIVVLAIFVIVIVENTTPPSLPEMHWTTRLVVISYIKKQGHQSSLYAVLLLSLSYSLFVALDVGLNHSHEEQK